MASLIVRIYLECPEKYKDCGVNARRYFNEHFTFEHYMNGLKKEIQTLITKNMIGFKKLINAKALIQLL